MKMNLDLKKDEQEYLEDKELVPANDEADAEVKNENDENEIATTIVQALVDNKKQNLNLMVPCFSIMLYQSKKRKKRNI